MNSTITTASLFVVLRDHLMISSWAQLMGQLLIWKGCISWLLGIDGNDGLKGFSEMVRFICAGPFSSGHLNYLGVSAHGAF